MKKEYLYGEQLVKIGLEQFIEYQDVGFNVHSDGSVECSSIFGKDYVLSEEEKEELTTPQDYDDEAILEEDFFEEG
jgi:hypothetical protein